MPRTKQPKMSKKMKKQKDLNNTSIASTSGSSQVFRSRKELVKALDESLEKQLKDYDDEMLRVERNLENQIKLMQTQNKGVCKTKTMKDFIIIATKGAEEGSEYAKVLKACLSGTYVPPTPSAADSNKTGSSHNSLMSTMSSASGSRRPPSSASSARSGHSRPGVPYPMGSAHRSRSVVKNSHSVLPGSGMKRRSMSQPCSLKKQYYMSGNLRTPVITPKVQPDMASTVLRLPKTGENLYSLGGSPVLANALASSSTAPQALIPLRDGRMLAILPTERNTMGGPMDFSPNTKHNLQLLKQNLNFLIDD